MKDLSGFMTVGDLIDELKNIDSNVWVCLNGFGPATKIHLELSANEPFIVIEGDGERSR